MSFFNPTNQGRVQKIMEILELISKSGNSNHADREQFQELLEPVIQAMAELSPAVLDPCERPEQPQQPFNSPSTPAQAATGPEAPTAAVMQAKPTTKYPTYIELREIAQNVPLKDLTMALAVFMNRIDELLDEVGPR